MHVIVHENNRIRQAGVVYAVPIVTLNVHELGLICVNVHDVNKQHGRYIMIFEQNTSNLAQNSHHSHIHSTLDVAIHVYTTSHSKWHSPTQWPGHIFDMFAIFVSRYGFIDN